MRRILAPCFLTLLLIMVLIGARSGDQDLPLDQSPLASSIDGTFPRSITAEFDSTIESIMAEYHLPGCAVAVFCTTGLYYTGTYGYAQFPDSIPITEHSIFGTMSVSKAITGTVLMDVWDDVHFDLDGDVSDYLDFSVVHPTCPDSAVTTRKIMAHVSGMPQEPWGVTNDMPICEGMRAVLDPEGALYDPDDWSDYCPGTGSLYSATNPCLAACMVEQLTGQSFADYSRQHVFEPLGMTGTAWFGDELDPDLVAHSYRWDAGTETFFLASENGPNEFRYPAVGFRTSIHDLYRFTAAMMNGGELDGARILDAATVDTMFTPQYPRVADSMGLMWFCYDWPSGRYWSHLGGGGDYTAAMAIHESLDYGVVMLINGGGGGPITILSTAIGFIIENLGHCMPVPVPESPPMLDRLAVRPNPFNPRTSIVYEITVPGAVRLQMFDLRGRLLGTLVDGEFAAGRHDVVWNGRDATGRPLSSGTYIVRMQTANGIQNRKVMLVR